MGYSITIGNAVLYEDKDYGNYYINVEAVKLENAPCWQDKVEIVDVPTKFGAEYLDIPEVGENIPFAQGLEQKDFYHDKGNKSNKIYHCYTRFDEFVKYGGLSGLFYCIDTGLFSFEVSVLCKKHLAEIKAAREKWEKSHPQAEPGWSEGQDHILAKLIWCEFWMEWTLKNCPKPSFRGNVSHEYWDSSQTLFSSNFQTFKPTEGPPF